ncbi:MAG: oxidoreductase [Proteobacteria bacterium]|nr:oxidoreductase [Pseudomonadota bacterium]
MSATVLSLKVADVQQLNPLIRRFRLVAPDGAALPSFTAGAHLRVQVTLADGRLDWRHYSLVNFSTDAAVTENPTEYAIAVRLEGEGRGGSRFMHERVKPGDTLSIEAPKNEFPLRVLDGCAVMIAGGIGITPITAMAAQRKAEGRPVRLHYAARSRSLMAFLPELQSLLSDDLQLHADDEAGRPLDIDAVLDGCESHDQLYVCGPKVMLDTVLAKTQARGWTHERVHFELFTTPAAEGGDRPIEVVLAQSGKTLTVPAKQTILDCLIEQGCDPLFDCKRGECGVCSTTVIEGDIDHRDYFLSDAEKKSNKVMQICVSRSRSGRIVLDL